MKQNISNGNIKPFATLLVFYVLQDFFPPPGSCHVTGPGFDRWRADNQPAGTHWQSIVLTGMEKIWPHIHWEKTFEKMHVFPSPKPNLMMLSLCVCRWLGVKRKLLSVVDCWWLVGYNCNCIPPRHTHQQLRMLLLDTDKMWLWFFVGFLIAISVAL